MESVLAAWAVAVWVLVEWVLVEWALAEWVLAAELALGWDEDLPHTRLQRFLLHKLRP